MKTYRCNLFSNDPLKNGVSFNQIEILKWEKSDFIYSGQTVEIQAGTNSRKVKEYTEK